MQSLEEFARDHQPAYVPQTSPVTAGLLTLALYAAVGFMANHHSTWTTPYRGTLAETVTRMPPEDLRTLSDAPQTPPRQKIASRQPSFLERLFGQRTATPPGSPDAQASAQSASRSSPSRQSAGAPAGSATAPRQRQAADGSASNSATPPACQDAAWARAVTNRVRQFFFYPQTARQRHVTGVAVARLVVRRSGWLNELEITGTSGNAMLDAAAYAILRKAQPLPRIPDRIAPDRIDVQLPIAFGMAGDFKPAIGNCGH